MTIYNLNDNSYHLHYINYLTGAHMKHVLIALAFFPVLAFATGAEYSLTIKNHQFTPSELRVPSGKKIKLAVNNLDSAPEEFESHDLNREKVIPGKTKATIYIGPLTPGKYTFIGEFHKDTAHGTIVAE